MARGGFSGERMRRRAAVGSELRVRPRSSAGLGEAEVEAEARESRGVCVRWRTWRQQQVQEGSPGLLVASVQGAGVLARRGGARHQGLLVVHQRRRGRKTEIDPSIPDGGEARRG